MNEIVIKEGNQIFLTEDVKTMLVDFERQAKEIKKKEDEIKKAVLQAMQENSIKKFESDELTITYVEGQNREYFDQKAFKSENPDLYDGYVSFKETAPSIRIKINVNPL